MAVLGRKVAATDHILAIGGSGNPSLAATIYGPVPGDAWVTGFGGRVGTQGATGQQIAIGAYTVDAAGAPDRWLGEVSFTLDDELTASGGASVLARQTSVGTGLANQGIGLPAGSFVALYCVSADAVAVSYAPDTAATTLVREDVTTAPDPFGAHDTLVGRALDLYLETAPNNASPVVKAQTLADALSNGTHVLSRFFNPSGHVAVWGGEPAVNHSRFDLVDEAHGDELSQVHLRLSPTPEQGGVTWERILTKGELYPILDPALATTYDLIAPYIGPKLPPGVYFIQARFADHFGAWSDWTPWLDLQEPAAVWVDRQTFYLAVSPVTTPRGRILTTTPDVEAIYGAESTDPATHVHLVVSEVVDDVPARVALSEVVERAADPGATITVAWDAAWDALEPGREYAARLRPISLDTTPDPDRAYLANAPEWTRFRVNAPPTVPADLAPAGGAAVGDYPRLTAVATDADDTPATGFGVQFRITDAEATSVTVTARLQPGTVDTWEYQTSAAELPATGSYDWDARAFDDAGETAWSDAASFVYGDAPAVTITAPAPEAEISGATFEVAWTSSASQSAYQVMVQDASGATVYDSDLVVSEALTHEVPTDALAHEAAYTVTVASLDETGLPGSASVAIAVLFSLPAAPTTLSATPTALAGDIEPTVVTLAWDQSADPGFVAYRVTRQTDQAGDDGTAETTLAIIDAVDETSFIDRFPASDTPYTYRVSTIAGRGASEVASAPASDTAQISLTTIVLTGVGFGTEARVVLRYLAQSDVERTTDETLLLPWGEAKPTAYEGSANYRTLSATFALVTDSNEQALEALTVLRRLNGSLPDAGARPIVCYRDDRGRKLFGTMRLREQDRELASYAVSLTFTETNHQEGA